MARYKLLVHCNACGDFHHLPIACSLENGPPKIKSVQDVFDGKGFPEWLACVSESTLTCPATGRRFMPDDQRDIFLVPIEEHGTDDRGTKAQK
jgi:hypothetical protein